MSASGISDANPIMPAAWSPQAQEGTPTPAQEHRRHEAESGNPPKPSTANPPKAHHKLDVRA